MKPEFIKCSVTTVGWYCTRQLLVCAADVSILGGSVLTVKKNGLVAGRETGLEVNGDKTKYMVMSGDQNARRSHSMKTDNSSIERGEEFKYLGTTVTDQISIQEEIKSRLQSGNVAVIWCRIFCLPVCYPKI